MMELEKQNLLDYIVAKLTNTSRLVQDNINKDNKLLNYRNGYYIIEKYVNDFLDGYNENRFLIMPGLRGLGKTTILFQIYDYIINEKGVEHDRILYLSMDELTAYFDVKLIDVINLYLSEIHQTSPVYLEKEIFILIDESHYDKNWSLTGKILFDNSKKIFTIFTGSSALNLEINADAARRAKKEAIYPMNYGEYFHLKYNQPANKKLAENVMKILFKGDSESVNETNAIFNELIINNLRLNKSFKKEWEDFLSFGGFPFGLYLDVVEIYERIFDIIDKIIFKDVFLLQSFKSETTSTILNIILFLALQKPGTTSHAKLAKSLGVSSSSIKTILDVLEKTHLIFNIPPYGSAGKMVRKSWKYYFLSPSLKAAINFKYGKYSPPTDRMFLGVLAENLVASYFFRTKENLHVPYGIFYDSDDGGVDFLLHDVYGEIIPVEVGIGDKNPIQINRAIKKYDSEYGVMISNTTSKIIRQEKIIYMPLTYFSFI